jgi:hypothetical protein
VAEVLAMSAFLVSGRRKVKIFLKNVINIDGKFTATRINRFL